MPSRRTDTAFRHVVWIAVALMVSIMMPCVCSFVVPRQSTTTTCTLVPLSFHQPKQQPAFVSPYSASSTRTRLNALLDVPDNFFTILLPTLSLFLAFSKAVARSRLEERAWEQRLEEARLIQMERDPSLTEVDLKKREAAAEWSAYGNSNDDKNESDNESSSFSRRMRQRIMTKTRQQNDDDDPEQVQREYSMTEDEIQDFENEFGVEFDSYYDDPYTEDELPTDVPFKVDKLYGDRIYKDGEVFYKDEKTGLYYRQGSQPRIQKFW